MDKHDSPADLRGVPWFVAALIGFIGLASIIAEVVLTVWGA